MICSSHVKVNHFVLLIVNQQWEFRIHHNVANDTIRIGSVGFDLKTSANITTSNVYAFMRM